MATAWYVLSRHNKEQTDYATYVAAVSERDTSAALLHYVRR